MRSRSLIAVISVSVVLSLATPSVASAQFGRLGRLVGSALDRLVKDRVKCVFNDLACVEKARAEGETPVLTDEDGTVIVGNDGQPITDPAAAAARIGAPDPTAPADPTPAAAPAPPPPPAEPVVAAAPTRPPAPVDPLGTGVWVDYDFVPGDRVLFYDDLSESHDGDVPPRFGLLAGDWDVAEWGEARYLRATSSGTISVELPETLPERFTVEFSVSVQHDASYVRLSTAPILHGDRDYAGSAVSLEPSYGGVRPIRLRGPNLSAERREGSSLEALVTLRVMADGSTMKVYLDDQLVADATDAVFPRTSTLFFSVASANPAMPVSIGPIRVAARGTGLYDRLETDGRAATQGIVFTANSDVIRPESTPTLRAVTDILAEHPELRLSIEGHTDSEPDADANLELSRRRAAAVKSTLISTFGVSANRLETEGVGDARPVADPGTPEGRQQNRRVEFVRLN